MAADVAELALVVDTRVIEQLKPVLVCEEGVEVIGAVADGVQSANNRPDACPDDAVNGHASLLDHLQHTHLGSTLCSPSTQHEGYFRPFGGRPPTCGPRRGGKERQKEDKHEPAVRFRLHGDDRINNR